MKTSHTFRIFWIAVILVFLFENGIGQETGRRDSINTTKNNWILKIYDRKGNLYGFSYDHRPSKKDSQEAILITNKGIMNKGQTNKRRR